MRILSRPSLLAWPLSIALLGIQLVPVERSNPPVTTPLRAPEDVLAVLHRSCGDCHSNQTRWPWYSHVAPVSWLVAHDVEEGREHFNLSTWGTRSSADQAELREEIWEEVEEGEMPLWFYPPLHPENRLQDRDRAVLRAWAMSGETEASHSSGPPDEGTRRGSSDDGDLDEDHDEGEHDAS